MSIKEELIDQINALDEAELRQVADYLAFLKFRARRSQYLDLDQTQLAALYAEFAEEDRELAEQGMADYAENLRLEDSL